MIAPVRRRHARDLTVGQVFEDVRSDYTAARDSRFQRRRKGLPAVGSGADYHYRSEADYLRLMEKARDMDRNDVIVGQLLDRATLNLVQEGFLLDTDTGDRGLNDELWARWDNWCGDPDQCDLAGELCFREMELMIPRAMDVDGDHFVLPNIEGSLELIEAHRCRTPRGTSRNVVHGVLMDRNRKRQEYWFTRDEIDPLAPVKLVSDMVRVPARDEDGHKAVLHCMSGKRVTQTRGVTALAPVFEICGIFEDLNFAKLVQAQVVSCFAIFKYVDEFGTPTKDPQTGEQTTQTLSDGSERVLEGLGPGMRINAKAGERFEGFSPAVPNAEFFQHVRLILTLIGINLGMPLVLTLMDASETNFSGFRGSVDQARMGFRRKQRWLRDRFHRPVYEWKVRQWLADDPALRKAAAKAGVNVFGHRWNLPSWPYIEPLTDASAGLLRVRNCLTSPRRYHAELGHDWDDINRETVNDNAQAIVRAKKAALKINGRFDDGQPVHWRELISLPTPDGVSIKLPEPTDPNQQQPQRPGDPPQPARGQPARSNPAAPSRQGGKNAS